MDDLARFALENASLCERLKSLRHTLHAAADRLPADAAARLASRDVGRDVGTQIGTPSESQRTGTRGIAISAAGRLAESLRSIEEAAKAMLAPEAAGAFESLRYEAYAAAKELITMLGAPRTPQWRLCVLISESLCEHHPWDRVAELAMEGGADCLQLREKNLDSREMLDRARHLVGLARRAAKKVSVIINDRADVALLAGADGVHVGQTDLSIADVRQLAGSRLLVGVSTSELAQAHTAVRDGADYLGLGPMFPSATKPKPTLAGIEYLREFLMTPQLARVPHLAISGITPDNAAMLASKGCMGVAVSSIVCGSPSPDRTCRQIVQALTEGRHA